MRGYRIAWIAAGLVILVGVVMTVIGVQQPLEFGWVAYAPLADEVYAPSGDIVMRSLALWGIVVTAVGAAGAAFLAGIAFGERSAGRR